MIPVLIFSVTGCLDHFSIFGHLRIRLFAQRDQIYCQSRFKILANKKETLTIAQNLQNFAKVAKFIQICSHCLSHTLLCTRHLTNKDSSRAFPSCCGSTSLQRFTFLIYQQGDQKKIAKCLYKSCPKMISLEK